MAAKTQDAAGETVLPQAVLIAMLDNIEDELRDCTAGLEREPTLRDDLIAIADRLNHVVTSLDMKPAAPRETAIAAPTGETEEGAEHEDGDRAVGMYLDAIADVLAEDKGNPSDVDIVRYAGLRLRRLAWERAQPVASAIRAALSTGGRDASE